jgi:hypothetical protein
LLAVAVVALLLLIRRLLILLLPGRGSTLVAWVLAGRRLLVVHC